MAATCAALIATAPALAAGYGTGTGSASAGDAKSSATAGSRLMTADGMSLYVFDKDSAEKSNCYGDCAAEWPPMTAAANASPSTPSLSVIRRKDGTSQWAWMGRPLYLFDEDLAPGDMKGDGYSPDWHLARATQ
jgi:predicted lipoprotein with Yx(FWY)xxD motif